MKLPLQTHSTVFTRSLLVLGFGCALATSPLGTLHAQDATPGVPTSAGEVDTTKTDPLNTKSTVPDSGTKVDKDGAKLDLKDKQFLSQAEEGNSAEVMLGELALKNADRQDVKDFAQKMITDHKEANAKLDAIAKSHGIADFRPVITNAHKATYAQMTSMMSTAFDNMYIKHAIADHETVLKDYKAAEGKLKDKALLDYAQETAKTVDMHLQMAKELEKTSTPGAKAS